MTGVSSFGVKVSDAFGINQATLSGAIDIIVVKHPPGSRPRCLDDEYKANTPCNPHYPIDDALLDDYDEDEPYLICSPFHVRFGKLQLLRSNEVNVSITINDEAVDTLQMKLGAAGEAYFVLPTDKPVQDKQYLVSPLVTPQKSPIKSVPIPSSTPKLQPLNTIVSVCGDTEGEPPPPPPTATPAAVDMTASPGSPTLSAMSSLTSEREVMSQLQIGTTADEQSATATCTDDNESATDNESMVDSLDMDNVAEVADLFEGDQYCGTHAIIEHIQMSLCGHTLSANASEANQQAFARHRVSYAEFCKNPSLAFDANLIVLYRGHMYPAQVAIPMLLSVLAFNHNLPNKAVAKFEHKKNVSSSATAAAAAAVTTTTTHSDTEHKASTESSNGPRDVDADVDNDNEYAWYWSWWKAKRKKKKKKKRRAAAAAERKTQKTNIDDDETNEDEDDDDDDVASITRKAVMTSDGIMSWFRKSIRPTSSMLRKLPLKPGANTITFTVSSTLQGTQSISACIFLWDATTKIVISDVDGTITKSDVMGHVAPLIVGSQWSHNGVARLFTNVQQNGYHMLYLTSRGIGQSAVTRSYLFENVRQQNVGLPSGPIVMSPDSLTVAFYREVIKKQPQQFKIPALRDIRCLFAADHNPFYAGFGNRATDLMSYLSVHVPQHRIFIIEPSGTIYTDNALFHTSYELLNHDVDALFMDTMNRQSKEKAEFNSLNFWSNNDFEMALLSDVEHDDEEQAEHEQDDHKSNTRQMMDVDDEDGYNHDHGGTVIDALSSKKIEPPPNVSDNSVKLPT